MRIGQESGRRLGERRSIALKPDAAQIMIAAALAIMFLALLLAAAAVQGATLPIEVPPSPTVREPAAPTLVLREGDGTLSALAPETAELAAQVDALAARVSIEHRFRAGPGAPRSGVYILPLPSDARLRQLALAVGERKVEIALATERGGAAEPDLLAVPISGIGAHAEVLVRLVYDRPVALGENRFVLALPLPRGRPPEPGVSRAGWPGSTPALQLDLDPGLPIAELRSPSHGIDIQRGPGERRRIRLSDPEPPAGRDFVLVWSPADPRASIAALRRFTAVRRIADPEPRDGLMLRARPIGGSLALTPAAAQPALLAGSPIDDGAILTAIAARSGASRGPSGPPVSPLVAGAVLAIWALGALLLATRRSALELFSPLPSKEPLT